MREGIVFPPEVRAASALTPPTEKIPPCQQAAPEQTLRSATPRLTRTRLRRLTRTAFAVSLDPQPSVTRSRL